MATVHLYNLARMTTATAGTGTITLGPAVSGFLSFATAGVSDGETVTYAISDGANSEIGRGVYTATGTTLTRSVLKSTNGGSAISLSGTAQVFITAAKEDFILRDDSGHIKEALVININDVAHPTQISGTMFELVQADGVFGRAMMTVFGQSGGWQVRRANGTNAAKTQVLSGDALFNMACLGYHSGNDYGPNGTVTLRALAEENYTSSAQGTQFIINTTPIGSNLATSTFRFRQDGSLDINGSGNTVITGTRHHQLRSYTVATLPSAATAGQMIYVSDMAGGAEVAFSDGTNWRRMTDRTVAS